MKREVEDALELLRAAGTDTAAIEAKSAAGGWPVSILESISAFANTAGGLVLLGVAEDRDFEVVEIDARMLASRLADACRDQLEPPVAAAVEIIGIEGRHVVAARIDELPNDQKPAYVKTKGMNRGSYVRVHDGDRSLTSYEVSVLLANRSQPRYDSEVVPEARPDDLDNELVDGFLGRLREHKPSTFAATGRDEALSLVGAIAKGADATSRPTLGGLLALGRYPQRWFPQLNIAVVAYPRSDNTPLPNGTRFLDNVAVDGPIPRMVVDAVSAVQRNLSRRSKVPSLLREDEWDYPIEVIRELIVNALMHRDLSPGARGTQVRVEIYPDRLEVHNPGGLFGPVHVDDLGTRTVTSSRNALLAKLLEDVPVQRGGAVAENRGSGFITLTRRLESVGMSRPVISDRVSSFSVLVRSESLLDDTALSALHDFDTAAWSDLQRLAVALAAREDEITNERLREVSGAHAADVGAAFVGLSQSGVLQRHGTGRGSRWTLRPETPASARRSRSIEPHPRRGRAPAKNGPRPATGRERARDTDQGRVLLELLGTRGPLSAGDLALASGLGTRRNVLLWLNRLEAEGAVEPTEMKRKSPSNRWRLAGDGPDAEPDTPEL